MRCEVEKGMMFLEECYVSSVNVFIDCTVKLLAMVAPGDGKKNNRPGGQPTEAGQNAVSTDVREEDQLN